MKLIILTVLLSVAAIMAQERPPACITNRNAPPVNAYYWPPDTNVKVYFVRGMFSPQQRATLLAAMKTWSDAAVDTGAGISFSYVGEIDRLASCKDCLTVTRREVYKNDGKHYAFFNPLKQDSAGLLISAWIDFDFATTEPKALQGFMAHELGHGLGLWDCKSCKKQKTIMNAFPGINTDNGLIAPSSCDLEVVRQVYQLQRRVDRNPSMGQAGSCKIGVEAPAVGFWTWAPNSTVKVYIVSSDFKDAEVPFLIAALSSWNAASESSGSRVKFEYQGTTGSTLYCENCLTIRRGQVFDKSRRHVTELTTYGAPQNRIITWATIVIDPLLTSPKTLTNAVAHELGHSFGLLDCYSCKEKSTVMMQFSGVNVSNDMDRPSACDLVQVKHVYQNLAAQLKRASEPKPLAEDEGEEPVEDDTPVVVPRRPILFPR